MTEVQALRRLARSFGVLGWYEDADGVRRVAGTDSVLAVLRALGSPIERVADAPAALAAHTRAGAEPGCEPVIVAWNGRLGRIPTRNIGDPGRVRVRVCLESGGRRDIARGALRQDRPGTGALRVTPPLSLPLGYHRVEVERGARRWESLVIAAPLRAPDGTARGWGVFLPLYALRTAGDWGVSDYGALRRLIGWAAAHGASFTGTLPLLPMFLDTPFEPSPYAPISRRFWGELHIDIEAAPHVLPGDVPDSLRRRIAGLRAAADVDYAAVARIKRRALDTAAARFFDEAGASDPDFHHYVRERPDAVDYARFRAACDAHRGGWDRWPPAAREGRLRDEDVDPADMRRHLFAAWVADRQLRDASRAAAKAGGALYLDLPLGVHPHGYDTWRDRGLFATGASVGAPPDQLFRGGQNWGFPPLSPLALRASGHAQLIATLRHHLRYAKLLRLDHVMSIQRLFWIPEGAEARDGVYVRYPMDELLAVLVLEGHRHGATLIGEDLGTVSSVVRRALRQRAIQRMFVVQYEAQPDRDPPLPEPPPDAMASLNTHDMPPFAAYWDAADLDDQLARGWIDAIEHELARDARRAVTRRLCRQLGLGADAGAAAARDALHRRLVAGRAARTLINLEDLWLERRPQNVPGTPSRENWRRKAALDFDELRRATGHALRALRATGHTRTTDA